MKPARSLPVDLEELSIALEAETADLRWYLDEVLRWSRIQDDSHVAGIEFGNETISGKGSTIVRQFDVTVVA